MRMSVSLDLDALMSTVHRHWAGHVDVATRSSARLSTNSANLSARDDAAGVAISTRHRSVAGGLGQAGRNVQDAMSAARLGQGALSTMTEMMQRMRVLAVQSANGTYTDEQRGHMQAAVVMTLDEMDRLVEQTQAAGVSMLGAGSMTVQAGAGAGDGVAFALADARRANLGIADGENGPGVNVGTQEGARSALQLLDEALQQLFEEQARTAAIESRMAAAARALAVQEANLEAMVARKQTVDVPSEAAKLARAQMFTETSVRVMQQVMEVQRSVLDLVRPIEPTELPDDGSAEFGAVPPVMAAVSGFVPAAPPPLAAIPDPSVTFRGAPARLAEAKAASASLRTPVRGDSDASRLEPSRLEPSSVDHGANAEFAAVATGVPDARAFS